MFRATIRNLFAHRLRLILTAASIALGVAFLAGTLILTDTMRLAFDQVFGKVSSGTDAVVRQEAAYTQAQGVGVSRKPIPATALDRVRAVPGVRAAEGSVSGYALLTDTAGKAVESSGGAPTMGYSMPVDTKLRGDVAIRSGRAPSEPSQVAIDATSADKHNIPLGSRIKVLFRGSTQTFTVVGTVRYGKENDLGGTTAAYFNPTTAQRVLGSPGRFDQIDVSAAPGVGAAELARRLDAVAPPGAEAVTGKRVAQEASDAIKGDLGFVTVLLSVFAAIALFVGSFIIWNTFTMIVTQRSREIALLRAVGATRRQVLRSLLAEAVLIGLGASALGIALGIGVAQGLTALMDAVGFSLPSTSMQIRPRTIWVSLVVGTIVTVVAALVPARRATRVLPVEALRESTTGSAEPSRRRVVVGAMLAALGLTALFSGLYGSGGIKLVGLGIVGTILGVTTLAPLVARPLSGLIGWPLRARGVPGELARQNAMRNPRRSAATAAALMIGLTMVVSVGVFAASLKASFGDVLGKSTNADLFLTATSAQAEGFSPQVAKVVAEVPRVKSVSPTGWGEARFDGDDASYSSIDPATAASAFNLGLSAGSVGAMGDDGVLVSKKTAKSKDWMVGDTVRSEFAATGRKSLRVAGIFDSKGYLDGNYLLSIATQDANTENRLDSGGIVLLNDDADRSAVRKDITAALADHPDAKVLDRKAYEKEASGFVDQLLVFVTVMLLLAVLIALLGIVNTLALSVYERTRELGLLRAVGMSRAQVRAMVRWESVVISLLGASVGAVLGIGLGLALATALKDEGIEAVAVPGWRIVLYVALAAIAGTIAAIGPARRAAKVDVLRAVVTE